MDETELRQRIEQYAWYHTVPLTSSVSTPGWPAVIPIVDMVLEGMRKIDWRGARVLDVGCRDGMLSFEAERLGAAEVVGIDTDISEGAAELLIPYLESRVELREANLFAIDTQSFGTFDVVLFCGVLYHLRYPFYALRLLAEVLRPDATLLIETSLLVDRNDDALLWCPTGSDSPYEPTSCTFFNRKGLIDTLQSLGLRTETFRYLSLPFPTAEHDAPRGPAKPALVDRALLVCRPDATVADASCSAYWEGVGVITRQPGVGTD